ncbi:MAG TPA: GntR family transcriptional regulator [Vicinamibacterales bacterium]|nr:GntR family transcriptional regulator [Vicinamibacterales bacterium]
MAPRLPFSIALRSGEPVAEQVIFAVTRSVVSGQLQAGDPFPSVRALSQELKINPNTAHRIVAALTEEGLLTVRPGIGTVVNEEWHVPTDRREALADDVERLVVEAKRTGMTLQQTLALLREQWARTSRRAG